MRAAFGAWKSLPTSFVRHLVNEGVLATQMERRSSGESASFKALVMRRASLYGTPAWLAELSMRTTMSRGRAEPDSSFGSICAPKRSSPLVVRYDTMECWANFPAAKPSPNFTSGTSVRPLDISGSRLLEESPHTCEQVMIMASPKTAPTSLSLWTVDIVPTLLNHRVNMYSGARLGAPANLLERHCRL